MAAARPIIHDMTATHSTPRPMSIESYAQARALSRQFFPNWSRHARARWVLAKVRANAPKVPISTRSSAGLRQWGQAT